jgi:allantoinase
MMFDTVIRGGTVVTPEGTEPLDIGITDGRITALLAPGGKAEARTTLEAKGKHILPGAIDIHFHVRAPAYPERGTVASETRAAAAGGVTTVFEMPISKPCCATPEIVRRRRELFAKEAYVNFALYGAPGTLKPEDITGMVDEGVIGFKIFTTEAPKGRDDEFVGLCLPDEGSQFEALKLVATTGLVTVVHAESNELLRHFSSKLLATGRNDTATHGESRPPVVEAVAISKLLTMNVVTGARLHIAHVTCRQAVEAIHRFQETMDVTGETCPQYLLFTEDDLARVGSYAKINPPLRTTDDQQALWDALKTGTLMAVTTDHSPFTKAEKEKAKTDIWAAPPGAPGVEELLIGMLDAVHQGKVTLEQAVALVSSNGAKRFGLYPQKGAIVEGADADLVIVDLDTPTTIRKENLLTEARLCDHLYDGMTFQAHIETTLVAGELVYHQGKIVGQMGHGKYVTNPGIKEQVPQQA